MLYERFFSKYRFFTLQLTCLLFLLGLSIPATAQFAGNQRQNRIDIPFEFVNGFIVVNVTFNHLFSLRFIVDTGAEHTILTKREYADILGIPFEREFRILGSDLQTELSAYLIRHNHLQLGNMAIGNQSLVVLEEDFFRFEEFTGTTVHGIIGANIFRHFIMKINYQRQVISLYSPNDWEVPDDFHQLPLEIYKSKPYLTTALELTEGQTIPVKLLLDTGASLTLLLHNDTHPAIQPPENTIPGNIGKGLGGYLEGFVGRARSLQFGSYEAAELVCNFQDLSTAIDTSFLNDRNGILGNLVLNRFTIIIDYFREKLYIKPNKYYDDAFEYDKSGLTIIATGRGLNTYLAYAILHDSPAGESGLLPGDEILRVNGWQASFLGLRGINRRFKMKTGKRIRMVIRRDGEKMKIEFRLRDLV